MVNDTQPGTKWAARPATTYRGTRILVVDDDEASARGLAKLLSLEGFEVSTAYNGREALEQLEKETPDALITDLAMPEMDGMSLLREVHQRYPDMLVMVLSGAQQRAEPVLRGGAMAFVGKPVQVDEVVSILDAGLQLRDEARRQ